MPAAEALERDLRTPASVGPIDTLARRLEDEWRKCLYVYHDQPVTKVRECLVFQYHWEPAAAERRISLFTDSLRREADSVLRVLAAQGREAAKRAAAAAEQARVEAEARAAQQELRAAGERRLRDSVYLATHRERLDGPDDPIPAGRTPAWVVDLRTGAYYLATCAAAAHVPAAFRKFYQYEIDAIGDGHWSSREPGCEGKL